MDFGSPVAGGNAYNPQQGMQTLGALYNIKNAQAQLANTQASLPGIQAQSKQAQQDATQRANTAAYMKDHLMDHIGKDGVLDLNSALSDKNLISSAGDSFPQVASNLAAVRQHQLDAQQALVNLNDSTRQQFQKIIGGLREDPDVAADNQAGRTKVQQSIDAFGKSSPDAQRIAALYGPMVEHAPQGKLKDGIAVAQLQGMSAESQASAQTPQLADTGTRLVNVAPLAAGGSGYGKGTGQGLNKDIAGVTTASEGAKSDNDLYNTITNAAKQAPQNKNILANLSKLADSGVFTGAGSQDVASLEGALSQVIPGFKGAGDAATDRQMMGKYTQQLAMSMTAQNYGTDQARDMVEHAIPNADNMTPAAIKKAAAYIQGQQQIAQARGAVANAYAQAHGGSTLGLRSLDTTFMQNIDPRMFDYVSLAGDKDKRAQFLKENFKSGKDTQDFLSKVATINHLGGFSYEQP